MSKLYICDHCDCEVHWSRKVSITPNGDNASFNILQGDSSHDGEYIHRKNFFRLDFCNVNCMVKSLTGSKYKAVRVEKEQ